MQFLINYLDLLLGKGLSTEVILKFITYNLSWMIVWGMPMGVLFSTLMAYGNLSANYEITILKASGAGLFRLLFPALVGGAFISVFLFWFNDKILPVSNHKAKTLMSDLKRTKPTFALQAGQFSSNIEGLAILPRAIDSTSGAMKSVTIYDYSRYGMLNIINADSGALGFTQSADRMLLKLYNGEIHQINNLSERQNKIIDFQEYIVKLSVDGFGFKQSGEDPMSRGQREMSIKELSVIRDNAINSATITRTNINNRIKKDLNDFALTARTKIFNQANKSVKQVQDAIINDISLTKNNLNNDKVIEEDSLNRAREYEVEIQKKYSIPFACFIFVLVGCPLGIRTKGGNFGISAAISLVFYVVYWACLIGGEKLADRGHLDPILSMWLADILIGSFGIFLCIRMNYENFTIRSLFKKK
jgi:lipopolysaccharide export system permease protein